MADAHNDLAANYYTGPPLDAQQAQVVSSTPAPRTQPSVGEQADAAAAAPQDAGDQANHTHVHGVPGYYKGRVTRTNTAAAPPPGSAVAPAAAPLPPAAGGPEKEMSWIDKLLTCFTGGKEKK